MSKAIGLLSLAALTLMTCATPASADTVVRIGWCARTVSSAAAPFAIATKMGWFKDAGFSVQLVPLPGSTDCVKFVGTGEVPYALPSVEPLASLRPQGLKAKVFYTAYQGNIYGPAVPADSPIKTLADLKGKKIGVQAMASAGYPVMRAIAASEGLNPDTDITIVVVGEGAQAAALVRSKQVDALSLYDVQYALIENAGVPLRRIEAKQIDRYPSNGFIALDETLAKSRAQAVALAQGYAKGTIFAINNPEAAVRILWEVFPLTQATGKDEATALKDDMKAIEARIVNWKLEKAGVTHWGENSIANYDAYLDFLLKWEVIKQKPDVNDVVTNDLLTDIDKFDVDAVVAQAKGYK
jgi:NitT/TauT family transport system substrate-binding protein